jgi:hypothetical protein
MTLDISQPVEKIYSKFSKSAKEDLRRMKKYRYPYEISSDLNKLEMFYYQMYLPYIISRHGKQANCASFYTFRHLFERGSKLMLIKHDDEYIFGSLFLIKKNRVHALYSGIMERKTDYLKKGVGAASYYFSILWAKENKAKFIDFGISRAFLNDGLFRYKKKWGTTIEKAGNAYSGIFAFKLFNYNKGIESFLVNNPFISIRNNQFKGIIFTKNRFIPEEINHLVEKYYRPNLTELVITPTNEVPCSLNRNYSNFHWNVVVTYDTTIELWVPSF